MRPRSRAACGLMIMCVLALWMESVQAGSSFLSPSQKPQGKSERKPTRVGRRFTDELPLRPETLDGAGKHIMFNAPFEIGISMSEEEFQEYGNALQRIVQDILTDTPPAE